MAYAGYDSVSVGEKCVTPVMYGLHSRVARCRHRADAPICEGSSIFTIMLNMPLPLRHYSSPRRTLASSDA